MTYALASHRLPYGCEIEASGQLDTRCGALRLRARLIAADNRVIGGWVLCHDYHYNPDSLARDIEEFASAFEQLIGARVPRPILTLPSLR